MTGLAAGMTVLTNLDVGLLHGLAVAAIAVILNAMLGLAGRLTPDGPTRGLALLAASVLFVLPLLAPQLTTVATLVPLLCGLLGSRMRSAKAQTSTRVECTTVSTGLHAWPSRCSSPRPSCRASCKPSA